MSQTLEYARETKERFTFEAEGLNSDGPRNRADWARLMAVEMRRQGIARAKNVKQANGEALPSPEQHEFLRDVLSIPELAAVEASLDRSRLLLQAGTDVAAMALDAANSIEAANSLERMLAHQLAVAHKQAMEEMGALLYDSDPTNRVKRLNATARLMNVYQQGLLTLHKLRQKGQQRIMVQYVNVSASQNVIANSEKEKTV